MTTWIKKINLLILKSFVRTSSYHSNLKHRMNHESGAALVEYALLVALVAVVALTAIATLGTSAKEKLDAAAKAIK